jgi:hypothetical protein
MSSLQVKQSDLDAANHRIAELEAVLGLTGNTYASTFKLPAASAKLFGCLMQMPTVSSDTITLRLGIATDAKVAMHRLRGALKDYCVGLGLEEIAIHSRRGVGYWIEPNDKERVRDVTHRVTLAPAN